MKKLLSTLRIATALMLSVFSSNILPVATAYAANGDSHTVTNQAWGGQGSTNEALSCQTGQTTYWHWILTPGGNNTLTSAALTVHYTSGATTTTTGVFRSGGSDGALHFDVSRNVVADSVSSASVTFSYIEGNGNGQAPFVLTISDSSCQGTATQTVSPPNVTVNPVCGPNNDGLTLPTGNFSLTNDSGWANNQRTITWTTNSGYVFTGGLTTNTQVFTDLNVECPAQRVDVPATPQVDDPCGPANASWIKPADTTSVTWSLDNGHLIASTTSGYIFTDQTTTHDYGLAVDSNVGCPATAAQVTFAEVCGTENDTYTIPSATGVSYFVNGSETATPAGTYNATGSVSVVAAAQAGYTLTAPYSANHTFTNLPCTPPPCQANCGGEEDKKVFVCKYVGTPGISERLQTGQNPISVSVNSIKDFHGIGSYFNDAQGRSYVLAYDNGQPEPSASECPGNEKPSTQVLVPVCVEKDHTTSVTIRVFNHNDFAVTYKVVVEQPDGTGTNELVSSIPANGSHDFTFNGYGVGTFDYTVYEGTQVESSSTLLRPLTQVPQTEFTWKQVFTHNFTIALCQHEQPPVVDVCLNLPGNQTTIPEGYVKDGDNCARVLGTTDVCPNIEGTQTSVPVGMIKDTNGNCATPVTPPAGGAGAGQVLGEALPAELPATGGTNIPNPLLSIVAGFLTYLFLKSRNTRKAEA